MVYPNNSSIHSNINNDYSIPIVTPYTRDVEMAECSLEQPSNLSQKTRSKRILHYRHHKPLIQWASTEKRIDFTAILPIELCSYIVSLLNIDSLLSVPLVSRRWASLFYLDELWKVKMMENDWKLKIPEQVILSEEEQTWYYWFKQRYRLESRWNTGKVAPHYLLGHLDSVYCVQFDDEKVITGSRDRTIKIWDLCQYQCTYTLEGHSGSVLCLQYDENIIVSGSSDTTVIVWDIKTRRIRAKLHGHAGGVSDVAFNDRYIVSSSKDSSIRIWDRATYQPIRMIMGHRGAVNSIQIQGDLLVSASSDSLIKLWSLSTGNMIREFAGHKNGLACVRFDGKRIVSGSNDHTIRVWDIETGLCLMVFAGHSGLVRNLRFNGDRIISASYDQSIRVWDINSGNCLLNFQSGHSSWIFDVCFDKKRIIRYLFFPKNDSFNKHCNIALGTIEKY
ncbi:WD40-repeat-containing domain protein [Sporodiniella umbellata]|nr:WD40-repeat-containing domain protein [Sporodiniella umbellata]